MAYWLVYQGDSYERSRAGGYLWAPQLGRRNQRQQYWTNMTLVEAGDIIFSGLNNAIRAVSMAVASAYDCDWPDPRDQKNWGREGWRLDVTYFDLPRPLPYTEWVPQLRQELGYRNSPFDLGGEPNQGFLYSIPASVGERLIQLASDSGLDVALETSRRADFEGKQTYKEAIVKARLGQGQFRKSLFAAWKRKCPLSGVDRPELLRASHIKPWSSSNNYERLDPSNGILLAVPYDAAFDALLITFSAQGDLVLASDFEPSTAVAVGISPKSKLPSYSAEMESYMTTHRELMAARVRGLG